MEELMDLNRINKFPYTPGGVVMALGFLSLHAPHITSINHYGGYEIVAYANKFLAKLKDALEV